MKNGKGARTSRLAHPDGIVVVFDDIRRERVRSADQITHAVAFAASIEFGKSETLQDFDTERTDFFVSQMVQSKIVKFGGGQIAFFSHFRVCHPIMRITITR
mmetsp:Transcript_36900/g.40764  ORF Transcript_36900/g.40764 Transcript_36900/m.40764 type:complete len:102 (+) Transcript_36900:147-452(+)